MATETSSALKQGNYVQGTVLLVLRRRTGEQQAFLDDLGEEIAEEVEAQLKSISALDDDEEPNFGDADYQLAAYAAALRAFTQYQGIPGVNLERELARTGPAPADAPLTRLIDSAREIASNYLIPTGLGKDRSDARDVWRRLTPEERFYIKGLEVEAPAEYRQGVYQEFARGFGLREYQCLLASGAANKTRRKTAREFGRRGMREGFGETLVRHALYGTWRTTRSEAPDEALTWFATELSDYWNRRKTLIAILQFFARMWGEHWRQDANAAGLLAGAVENDHPRG
ncbi:MAG: hypothetical protein L0H73_10335 [Nitrococcus sp.]|nr:hypothetical protein [Nitrococcus sp.]